MANNKMRATEVESVTSKNAIHEGYEHKRFRPIDLNCLSR